MSKLVMLVSLEDLKTLYGFDLNQDQAYIIPNIYKGQRYLIKPLLGDEKYDELCNYVEGVKFSGYTLNSFNEKLLEDYIQPALAYYVKSEIIYNISYKMKNASQDADPDRFDELVKISKKYLNDSDAFMSQLRDFMEDNAVIKGEDYEYRAPFYFGDTSMYDKTFKMPVDRGNQTINKINKFYI